MWDGSLFVYKSKEDFNNERFDYRIPVQVKASEFDGDVFPETTSFSIEVTDLQNYLKDGGLVFFKVLVKGKVSGNIVAEHIVHVTSTGSVNGDITSAKIVLENGCFFSGKCTMDKKLV